MIVLFWDRYLNTTMKFNIEIFNSELTLLVCNVFISVVYNVFCNLFNAKHFVHIKYSTLFDPFNN